MRSCLFSSRSMRFLGHLATLQAPSRPVMGMMKRWKRCRWGKSYPLASRHLAGCLAWLEDQPGSGSPNFTGTVQSRTPICFQKRLKETFRCPHTEPRKAGTWLIHTTSGLQHIQLVGIATIIYGGFLSHCAIPNYPVVMDHGWPFECWNNHGDDWGSPMT